MKKVDWLCLAIIAGSITLGSVMAFADTWEKEDNKVKYIENVTTSMTRAEIISELIKVNEQINLIRTRFNKRISKIANKRDKELAPYQLRRQNLLQFKAKADELNVTMAPLFNRDMDKETLDEMLNGTETNEDVKAVLK